MFKFIQEKDGRLVLDFILFRLKFNLKFGTNKLYYRDENGCLKRLRKLPKGLKIKFHGHDSTVILPKRKVWGRKGYFDIFNNVNVEIEPVSYLPVVKLELVALDNSRLHIKEDFSCAGTYIVLGENSSLNIGSHCMFSNRICIRTYDGHPIYNKQNEQINFPKDIVIGDKVWLGHNVTILKGVQIPSGTIIGTNTTITQSFNFDGNDTIVAGIPPRIIKREISWER